MAVSVSPSKELLECDESVRHSASPALLSILTFFSTYFDIIEHLTLVNTGMLH